MYPPIQLPCERKLIEPVRGPSSRRDHVHIDGACPRVCRGVLRSDPHQPQSFRYVRIFYKSGRDETESAQASTLDMVEASNPCACYSQLNWTGGCVKHLLGPRSAPIS